MYLTKNIILLFVSLLFISANVLANNIEIQQVLRDGVNSVDGLDNPRQVQSAPNGNQIFVTSADDNALLILEFDGTLKPLQLFKNNKKEKKFLEGASSLVSFNEGTSIAVASFYDSAVSVFEKGHDSRFNFIQAYSDNVSYERIFKSSESLVDEDNYGLFGAWDIAVSSDENHIYVASYKSNAISVFNIRTDDEVAFKQKYVQPEGGSLGNPTSIALSDVRNELIVAGFENNTLSVLKTGEGGAISLKQTIQNGVSGVEHLINPIKVLLSPNEQFLYVACSGSNAILVFESENNQYAFLQSITHSDTDGTGLAGVASIALTNDGSQLYAASEMDEGLLVFDVKENGHLQFNQLFQSLENKIEGVTSIEVMSEGKHILLTLGKMDALYLLKISDSESK